MWRCPSLGGVYELDVGLMFFHEGSFKFDLEGSKDLGGNKVIYTSFSEGACPCTPKLCS